MITNLLLIGAGRWGSNYVSTINNISNVRLKIANRETWKQLIDEKPDGVIIATPPSSHIEIAKYSLSHNIPTMIEKPLSLSLSEALELKQFTAPILVNHIHLFSSAYQYIKNNLSEPIEHVYAESGDVVERADYNALWDWGPHDLSMILDLMQKFPTNIKCDVDSGNYTMQLKFDNVNCNIKVGSNFEKKKKYFRVWTKNNLYVYDDLREIKLTKNGESVIIENYASPLTTAVNIFINTILGGLDGRVGLNLAIDVINVLEQCNNLI